MKEQDVTVRLDETYKPHKYKLWDILGHKLIIKVSDTDFGHTYTIHPYIISKYEWLNKVNIIWIKVKVWCGIIGTS